MQQRSPEWFAARKGRVTASNIGAILGNDPYRDRDDVMRAMVRAHHGAETEFKGNVATEYGTFHEEGALAEYEMFTGNKVTEEGFVTLEDWAGCSPDGLISLVGGLEIKCPFGKRKMAADEKFKTLEEQPHYHDQIQFSLYVTQRAWWDFWQWSPHANLNIRVEPCSKWRSKNIKKLKAFWEEYLHEREHDFQKHLEDKRVTIDTPEALRLAAEYDELKETADKVKERLDELKTQIVDMCKGRDALFAGKLVTKVEKKGSISYAKAVKALLPDADLAPYTGKPSSYWKIG